MPDDRPMTPSLFSVDGVASKDAVKEPACVGKPCDCQAAELTKQPDGAVLVRLKLAGVAPAAAAVTV